ncbi:MAG: serine/threonine protein kinase [Muribaculaceae bacterium]|nr:serine/threonine protein kinase [Muribaculaceae bacterium]
MVKELLMDKDKDIMNALDNGTILHGKTNDYKIVKPLGQGTFGITYLASVIMRGELGEIETGAFCAIKEFFMKDFNGRIESTVTSSSKDGAFGYYKEKFIKEARNLGRLKHPNIIKVMELFEENSTAYYVMEYIDGGSLDQQIRIHNGLSEPQTIRYTKQIGAALEYMHSNHMLHLDLKPNNVMIRDNGEAVLIDFGLSKQFDANGKPETTTKIGQGTPGYSPLEQAHFGKDDYTTLPSTMDIYALGATIFKMITGSRPPEASMILNYGFPSDELDQKNCTPTLRMVIEKCMASKKNDRYQSVREVMNALPKTSDNPNNQISKLSGKKGYYLKKEGEREYGTLEFKKVPVTDSINTPEFAFIRVWSNRKRGFSFEFSLMNECPGDTHNKARIWYDGKQVVERNFAPGIPEDVENYLIEHGFLSTEHWERESSTTPVAEDFGFDVYVKLTDNTGRTIERRVKYAHPNYHDILLKEVIGLFQTTSLKCFLDSAKEKLKKEKRLTEYSIFKVPEGVTNIVVKYSPCTIGCYRPEETGFRYNICTEGGENFKESKERISLQRIPDQNFKQIISDINKLTIKTGPFKKFNEYDFSEEPGKLRLSFWSKDKGWTELSLTAFNTDVIGGNIYRANINELANAINKIFIRNVLSPTEPTKELIYSIPESTYVIEMDYAKGGITGLTPPNKLIRIGLNKTTKVNFGYLHDQAEFSRLVEGLRNMNLRSKDTINLEPPTGVVFPTLRITLYDYNGNRIKSIFAQDYGNERLGNVTLSVKELRDRISEISPFYSDHLADDKGEEVSLAKGGFSICTGIIVFILISLIIGVLALPTYLYVSSEDSMYSWLWGSLAIAELMTAFLFNISYTLKRSKEINIFETVCMVIAIVSLIAYLVFWIIQMYNWWA